VSGKSEARQPWHRHDGQALRERALPDIAAWIDATRHQSKTRARAPYSRSLRLAGNTVAQRVDGLSYPQTTITR